LQLCTQHRDRRVRSYDLEGIRMEADKRLVVLLGWALSCRRDVQGRLLWLPEVGRQNYVAVGEVNELVSKVIISGSGRVHAVVAHRDIIWHRARVLEQSMFG
jgi:hypothetical protein